MSNIRTSRQDTDIFQVRQDDITSFLWPLHLSDKCFRIMRGHFVYPETMNKKYMSQNTCRFYQNPHYSISVLMGLFLVVSLNITDCFCFFVHTLEFRVYSWLCAWGVTPGSAGLLFVVPGIEPGSATCDASPLPTVLSLTQYHYL